MVEFTFLAVVGWIVGLIIVGFIAYRAYQNYGLIAMIFLLPFAAAVDILLPPYGPDLETPLAFALRPYLDGGLSGLGHGTFQTLAVLGAILLILGIVGAIYGMLVIGGTAWIYGLVTMLIGALLLGLKTLASYPLIASYAVVYAGAALVVIFYVGFFGMSTKDFS